MQIDGLGPVLQQRPSLPLERADKPSATSTPGPAPQGDTTVDGFDPDGFVKQMIEEGRYDADAPRSVGGIAQALKELRLSIANASPERLAQLLR